MKFLPLALVLAVLPAPAQSFTWRHDSEGLEVIVPDTMAVCAATVSGFTVPLAAMPCDAVRDSARVELSLRDTPTPAGPGLAVAMCGTAAATRSTLWVGSEPLYRCSRPTDGGPERHFGFGARVAANNDPRSVIALDLHCRFAQLPACRDLARRIGRAAQWFADLTGAAGEPRLRLDPAGNRLYLSSAHGLVADLPAAWTVCVTPSPGSNHGLRVPMDPGGCDTSGRVPEVAFVVSYNPADGYGSTPAMRRGTCGHAPAHWSDLRIAGTRLMRCTLPVRDGLAEIAYFGLRRRPGGANRISTVMKLMLSCPSRRMSACHAIAGEIAARMRPWAPD